MPLVPAQWKPSKVDLSVRPVRSKLQASQDYTVRPYLKKRKVKKMILLFLIICVSMWVFTPVNVVSLEARTGVMGDYEQP